MAPERIAVEVVCAEAGRQTVLSLSLPAGSTAGGALAASGILARHPGVDPASCTLGIFGREVPSDRLLRDGDRVEVLRPLLQDPRERRRQAARESQRRGRSARRG